MLSDPHSLHLILFILSTKTNSRISRLIYIVRMLDLYDSIVLFWVIVPIPVFFLLFKVKVPYPPYLLSLPQCLTFIVPYLNISLNSFMINTLILLIYGKFSDNNTLNLVPIPSWLGWMIMESPTLFVSVYLYISLID